MMSLMQNLVTAQRPIIFQWKKGFSFIESDDKEEYLDEFLGLKVMNI
jgi:hypothetical protein